jgi:hypothetical protein
MSSKIYILMEYEEIDRAYVLKNAMDKILNLK